MLISAKEIIEKSIALYKEHYLLYLRYMLLLFVPTGIIAVAGSVLGSFAQAVVLYGLGITFLIYAVVFVTGTLVSMWISLAFIKALAETITKQTITDPFQQIKNSTKYIVPALIASILTSLAVLGGIILLVIPCIIFAIWFSFALYNIALDDSKGLESLHNSKELVRGRWWEVFWRLLAPGIVFGILAVVIQSIIGWPFGKLLQAFQEGDVTFALLLTLATLVNVALGLLITPLSSLAPTILYLELKKNPTKMEHPIPSENAPEEPPLK